MEYRVKIMRRAQKDIHIYRIVKKTGRNTNVLTKLFIKVFSGNKKEEL